MRKLLFISIALTSTSAVAAGTAVKDAAAYVARIQKIDRAGPHLNSVIAINPNWRAQAAILDKEQPRSPIHGRAILIKDNIETADMPTTAGSLALARNNTGHDAPLVAQLRAAGALILGKTNLSEWANIRSPRSMSGWSAVGGVVRNPYALDRTSCGSSSGSGAAVAAGLAWAAIGTETDGSVVCPASINGLVGLKPTKGLVSAERVVPISHSQDTPGPMARSVREVAQLMDVLDSRESPIPMNRPFARALTGSIKGIRFGVLRGGVSTQPAMRAAFEQALGVLRRAGAVLVEIEKLEPPKDLGENETKVLMTELKADLNAYLATTPATVKTRTLVDVIAFNTANAAREMPYFGQETFIEAEATKGLDDLDYQKALAASRDGARMTLGKLLADNKVQILLSPTYGAAWLTDPVNGDQYTEPSASTLPAVSGYPHLTVPMGQIRGLPVGLSFIGPANSDALLLNAGDAFEAARGPLPPPSYAPTVPVALDPVR